MGVMLAPENNNRSQIVKMRQISRKFGDRVRVRFIRGHDVLQELNITVMRSLNWPVPITTLTEREFKYMMAIATKKILSKMKIVTTIKRKVIYGPVYL